MPDNSSDDEAPEAISFEASRSAALAAFKAAAAESKKTQKRTKKKKAVTDVKDTEEDAKSRLEALKDQAVFDAEESDEAEPVNKVKKFDESESEVESDEDLEQYGATQFQVRKLGSKGVSHVDDAVLNLRDSLLSKNKRESSNASIARRKKLEISGKNVYC